MSSAYTVKRYISSSPNKGMTVEKLARKILADAGIFDYDLMDINIKDTGLYIPSFHAIVGFIYPPPEVRGVIWDRVMEKNPSLVEVSIELPVHDIVFSHMELLYWKEE